MSSQEFSKAFFRNIETIDLSFRFLYVGYDGRIKEDLHKRQVKIVYDLRAQNLRSVAPGMALRCEHGSHASLSEMIYTALLRP